MHRSLCSLALILCGLLLSTPCVGGESDGKLDIYWIDVEGGAATLIVTPNNESLLVDTGNPGLRDSNRIAQVATKVAGLKSIDHLVVTHYHRDHYGGAELLSTMLPIGNVYDNGVFDGMPDNPGKAYFEFKCGKRHVIRPGDQLKFAQPKKGPRLSVTCLAAQKKFISADQVHAVENPAAAKNHKPKDRDGSDNANSVVLLVQFGDFQFYDGGDLTWNQELKLVSPYNLVGEVDVYQVTHHGLDSSNNPVVLQALKPRVAIMNNGHRKGCMPEVFANLKATNSLQAIYQVHKNLREDGATNNVEDDLIANHHAADECKGHYIKLAVAPDAKQYSVQIPARKHERTFKTK